MVKLKLLAIAAVLAVAILGPPARAAEPQSECPDECQRRAKAAFAFARARSAGEVSGVAPMPREVVRAVCACGSACECPAGICPKCVPAAPAAPTLRVIGYRRECDGRGGCYWVPVYGP
jgi:hypothetical protein